MTEEALGREVARRKEAEAALMESEARLSLLFRESVVALSIYSLERQVYLEVNQSFLDHTGYAREEVVDRPEIAFWSDPEEKKRFLEELQVGGRVTGFEFGYRRKDGTTGNALAFATLVELGGEWCILGENYDITEQKLLECSARRGERMLRTLTENLPGFLYTYRLDPDDREAFLYASPGIWELCGLEAEAVVLDISALRTLIHSRDLPGFRKAVRRSARTLEPFVREFRIHHPQKGERWMEARARPEPRNDGSVIWHGITLDVTDRKTFQLQAELVESAIRHGGEAMYIVSPSRGFRFVFVNDAACQMTGYSREELLEMTPLELDPTADPERIREVGERIEAEKSYLFETTHRRKNGSLFPVENHSHEIRFNGERMGISVVRDITGRKREEEELERLNRALRLLSGCSMLLTRADDEEQLLDDVCRLVVEEGGYEKAWVEYGDGGEGCPADHVVLPLENGSERFGALCIRTFSPDTAQEEELRLLKEMAENLAFGIVMLRLRGEQVRMEAGIRARERGFRTLAENSPDTIARYDRNCVRTYANPTFARMAGKPARELVGKKPTDYNPTPEAEAYEAMLATAMESGETETEYVWPDREGNLVTSHIRMVPERNDEGEVVSVLAVGRDITHLRKIQAQMEHMAHHDALTGLPNRTLIRDRTDRAIAEARRNGGKVALLFVDLDNFKAVNDSLGHAVGDRLLTEVAKRLGSCVRETDTVGRQGGDEFVITLGEVADADGAAAVAEKILRRIGEPMEIGKHGLLTSLSIGIALSPDDGDTFEALLTLADRAMYHAKESGRNTYSFFSRKMNRATLEHLLMRNHLKEALENGEFLLYYQPQAEMKKGKVVGVEALLRWNRPDRGIVPPGEFIPVAESSGLIVPIGEWILREACRQGARWQKERALRVAVNVSAIQFRRGDLVKTVVSALEESGMDPFLLELELTESILIDDTDNVLETVRRLKALGVGLSIDDFGTGYSSLAYLKRFAVDRLKIDRSFVRGLADDMESAVLVRTIIQMARNLGLRTIAEGVEDEETLAVLRLMECDEVQGYHVSRPMSAEALERKLSEI